MAKCGERQYSRSSWDQRVRHWSRRKVASDAPAAETPLCRPGALAVSARMSSSRPCGLPSTIVRRLACRWIPRVCSTTSASGRIRSSSTLLPARASPRSVSAAGRVHLPARSTASDDSSAARHAHCAARGARPETRRMAVMFLGRALDDSTALAAIRLASEGDLDPYVRGECLMCLGLVATEVVEFLVAGAEQLVDEASKAKADTFANDLAREGASYGILGALLAATRDGRSDIAARLRSLAESLDPRPTVDHSNLPSRQRRALLDLIANLDRPIEALTHRDPFRGPHKGADRSVPRRHERDAGALSGDIGGHLRTMVVRGLRPPAACAARSRSQSLVDASSIDLDCRTDRSPRPLDCASDAR